MKNKLFEFLDAQNFTSKEAEEPGLVTADNGDGTVSIFLHRGLKSGKAAPSPTSER